jgi:hypothetical protein
MVGNMKSKPLPRGVSGINNWQSPDVRGPVSVQLWPRFSSMNRYAAKKDQADSDAQDPDIGVAQASAMI